MERRDVLQGDEDVTVELDVRDILERAVRGQNALMVLPSEQRDLDLLALVLVRVVLDGAQASRSRSTERLSLR
jgi:hypothetical protein